MDKPIIVARDVQRYFKQYKKDPGLKGALKALVSRDYREIRAVDGVSFEIQPGEMVGFVGPNGAGKTTTLKMLSGLLHPTGGSVEVLGYEPFKRQADFQKQFSLVMGQKAQLWWDLPAIESFNLNKEIYEVPQAQFDAIVNELSDLLEIRDVLQVQVRKLSLGQRMKCELLGALIHNPKVLFLDEPTIGLDVVVQKKIREFFKEYNRKFNTTVILTSHYMDDVKELCERLIIINKGKLIYDGGVDEIIHTYAHDKYLEFVFHTPQQRAVFEQYGRVVSHEDLRVTLAVPRERHTQVAGEILQKFEVDDLDIQEAELEDIISQIFSSQK